MHAVIVSLWAQGILCGTALLLNFTLAVVVYKSSRQDMGFYKWMLIAYAMFEIIYAIVVLQAMPVSYSTLGDPPDFSTWPLNSLHFRSTLFSTTLGSSFPSGVH